MVFKVFEGEAFFVWKIKSKWVTVLSDNKSLSRLTWWKWLISWGVNIYSLIISGGVSVWGVQKSTVKILFVKKDIMGWTMKKKTRHPSRSFLLLSFPTFLYLRFECWGGTCSVWEKSVSKWDWQNLTIFDISSQIKIEEQTSDVVFFVLFWLRGTFCLRNGYSYPKAE